MRHFLLFALLAAPRASHALVIGRSGQAGGFYVPSTINNTAPTPPPPPPASTCYSTDPINSACMPDMTYVGPPYVWTTVNLSTKVRQDVDGPVASSSHTILIAGPRGSTQWGEAHIQAPSNLSNFTIWSSSWVNSLFGVTITTETGTAANSVQIFCSSYVYVSTPSALPSAGYMGGYHYIPDAQIPITDAYFHQQTNLFPMSIASGKNQTCTVEVRIATGIPSGIYAFNLYMSTGGNPLATIPGALEVYEATIPFNATYPQWLSLGYALGCQSQYGGTPLVNSGCGAYNAAVCGADGDLCALIMAHDFAVAMNDRRISVGEVNPAASFTDARVMQYMGDLLQGTTAGWTGAANSIFGTPRLAATTVRNIGVSPANAVTAMTSFANNGVLGLNRGATYRVDEASLGTLIANVASMTSVANYGGQNLITSAYATMVAAGADAVTGILCETNLQKIVDSTSAYNWSIAASSRTNGWYHDCLSGAKVPPDGKGPCLGPTSANFTGGGSGYSNPHIDGFAINNEMGGWSMIDSSSTYNITSRGDQCWGANPQICGGPTRTSTGPWKNDNGGGDTGGGMQYDGWGDETELYPGGTAQLGVSKIILVVSRRFMSQQAAEQDMELAKLLTDAGQGQYVFTQKNTFMSDQRTFNEDPYNVTGSWTGTITSARRNMGCKIHQINKPGASCAF